MALSKGVARRIVERVSELLSFNVNVMDDRGQILASGDVSRIGQVHEGAVLAIARKRKVVIDDLSVHNFRGSQPGVNLPFTYRGGVYGVIGITGDPEEVTDVAELLRMTAELIVEQAVSTERLAAGWRDRDEFVTRLLSSDVAADAQLEAWAEQLDYDLHATSAAVVLRLRRPSGGEVPALRDVREAIEREHHVDLVARTGLDELVLLVTGSPVEHRWNPRHLLEEVLRGVPQSHREDTTLSVGVRARGASQLRDAVFSAQETARIGAAIAPKSGMHVLDDLVVPVMVAGMGDGWRGRDIACRVSALVDDGARADLLGTAVALFRHDWNVGRTADDLYVHRNTIRYRVDRMADLTGLDLDSFEGRLTLYVGLLLDRLGGSTDAV